MSTCTMEDYLGAYLLDALEPGESETVRTHLSGCFTCLDELASLTETVSLLRLLSPDDVEQLYPREHSPAVAQVQVVAQRPGRRTLLALAAAALVLVTTGSAVTLTAEPWKHSPAVVHTVDPATQVRAAASVTERSSGSEVHLRLSGAYPSGSCYLVARSRDGHAEKSASWVANAQGGAEVTTSTAIPVDQLTELDVYTTAGRRLVRLMLPAQGA
jgi:hypothetical protein